MNSIDFNIDDIIIRTYKNYYFIYKIISVDTIYYKTIVLKSNCITISSIAYNTCKSIINSDYRLLTDLEKIKYL